MGMEIEAKMRVEDQGAVVEVLRGCGAVEVGDYLEINSFYDTADRALLAKDEGLRLRVARELGSRKERYVLTHKGENLPGVLKMREETELVVESGEDAEKLLERLGFVRYLRFEKRRRSWELDECKIELDRLPVLGRFVEIEGPSEAAVMAMREKLRLGDLPLVKRGYASMVRRHLDETGKKELVFAGGKRRE
jgi:predicted adenylyl cyclase CyaB